MKEKLEKSIKDALTTLGAEAGSIVLEHPGELSHGDYSTNASLAYAKQLGKNPRELAELLVAELVKSPIEGVAAITIAGPGFINFSLSRDFFTGSIQKVNEDKDAWGSNSILGGKKVMVEYTQPNPFKPFHIGHLMSNAIGESISRIVEFSGAQTIRANYQGDVGLHVGKAIYGLLKKGKPDASLPISAQAEYIGTCYSWASNLYDTDEAAKAEIDALNKKVYEKSDPEVNALYDWGRKITLDAFEEIYEILGTKFDYYFFESEMAPIGVEIIRKNMPGVFEESDGAVVFHGEAYDPSLHTRVFITRQGLATYEAKEIGLNMTKFEKENPDLSITETAIEQGEYMKVVRKAIEQIDPAIASRMRHITHGMMRVESGKMSSRKGNIITGESLLRDSMDVVREKIASREWDDAMKDAVARIVGVAALKYAILHQAIGGNIIYDEEKSVSFEGDSGPYLQYSVARAQSVLKKAEGLGIALGYAACPEEVTELERLLYRFPEAVARASETFEPHHIVTALIELASAFNSFYANRQVANETDPEAPYKVALTEAFVATMKNGLSLLGIEVPEKM